MPVSGDGRNGNSRRPCQPPARGGYERRVPRSLRHIRSARPNPAPHSVGRAQGIGECEYVRPQCERPLRWLNVCSRYSGICITAASTESTLFRQTGVATCLVSIECRRKGSEYLGALFRPFVNRICSETKSMEVHFRITSPHACSPNGRCFKIWLGGSSPVARLVIFIRRPRNQSP